LIWILYRDAFLVSLSQLGLGVTDAVLSSTGSVYYPLPYAISIAFLAVAPCRIILNLRESNMHVDEADLVNTESRHVVVDNALIELDTVA